MKLLSTFIFFLLLIHVVKAQQLEKIVVSQTYDDMEEFLSASKGQLQDSTVGELDYDSEHIELGFKDGDTITPQLCGFRFDDILIGQGRNIKSAYIQFQLYIDSYTDSCAFYIFAEDTADAVTFATASSGGNSGPGGQKSISGGPGGQGGQGSSTPTYDQYELSARTKLSDSILWTMGAGENATTDGDFQTVDLTKLVQQLINKSEWDSTNAMAFYIKPVVGTRVVESYDSDESNPAKLFISYELNHIDSIKIMEDSIQTARLDSIMNLKTGSLKEDDYTVPTWTLLNRAQQTFRDGYDYKNDTVTPQLELAVDSLQSKEMPYNVCMAINGDPKTNIGFTWFTNQGITNGEVQIVKGEVTDTSAFKSPLFTFSADTVNIEQYYCNSRNGLDELAGLEDQETRKYTSHKALATGLTMNTTYSYRVGKSGAWSPVGRLRTGVSKDDTLHFMYMADTQAMNDEYFEYSRKTAMAAYQTIPDARFCLMTGDLVESQGSSNSEWEWEQWFELMQPVWKDIPIAPVIGNHDISPNKNLTYHFNTASVGFDQEMSTTPGGIYSFVYGDALFIAMSTEDYSKENFLDSLKQYVYDEVAAHPDVRWKFVFYHKTIYTGSSSHQSDADSKVVREAFVPVFDSLGIDMAFQGHDHLYEVIGVTRNYELVDGSVVAVDSVSEGGVRSNMTGKQGGIYDVTDGTLFLLNCNAGKKKYSPRTKEEMDDAEDDTGITNYWGLFTGKFGQPDLGTFSDVVVTHDTVYVTTYAVDGDNLEVYDAFKVTKDDDSSTSTKPEIGNNEQKFVVYPNPASSSITINGIDDIEYVAIYSLTGKLVKKVVGDNKNINISSLQNGYYLIRIKSGNNLYVEQFIVTK